MIGRCGTRGRVKRLEVRRGSARRGGSGCHCVLALASLSFDTGGHPTSHHFTHIPTIHLDRDYLPEIRSRDCEPCTVYVRVGLTSRSPHNVLYSTRVHTSYHHIARTQTTTSDQMIPDIDKHVSTAPSIHPVQVFVFLFILFNDYYQHVAV